MLTLTGSVVCVNSHTSSEFMTAYRRYKDDGISLEEAESYTVQTNHQQCIVCDATNCLLYFRLLRIMVRGA